MEIDWVKIKNLDWKDIDAVIFTSDSFDASRALRRTYADAYGETLLPSNSGKVLRERRAFLLRYQYGSFAESAKPDYARYLENHLALLDLERVCVTAIVGIWNVSSQYLMFPAEAARDCLIVFAEYVNIDSDREGTKKVELFAMAVEKATIFDPEYPGSSHLEILNQVESLIKPFAAKLEVPYSIEQEPVFLASDNTL